MKRYIYVITKRRKEGRLEGEVIMKQSEIYISRTMTTSYLALIMCLKIQIRSRQSSKKFKFFLLSHLTSQVSYISIFSSTPANAARMPDAIPWLMNQDTHKII